MSILITFFTAPDDTSAAAVLPTGPGRAFESVSFGGFDPEEAAVEWEHLLTGADPEELLDADEPRTVADHGDGDSGCLVFALSPRLSTALATAEPATLRSAATAWTHLRAEDGERIDADIASAIMDDLAALATTAAGENHGVYCWIA
ncbi:hypothetical protein ACFYS8_00960 [Kitasatospora sp. NPDC004615]|uniref:hypothetical protein n=1 Tax=Kitasatospora sp. NPDC004615 TaxID=3364017 RepID=UPI003698FF57